MKEITEYCCDFETAKLLKEKGFDEKTSHVYYYYEEDDGWTFEQLLPHEKFEKDKMIHCPTQALAMKWLREQGFYIQIDIDVDYDEDERGTKWYYEPAWDWTVFRIDERKQMSDDGALYATYEQAAEVAIKWCLENLF